ncbi:hypothetical protein MPTK1_5g03720 [Marchantia polymorpha subsp. ruderalis]|uniref:Secreted protein n=2 Tax=Marchantia polymorpha TaxID=3197 RepID=A0AAF6BEM4_MARPO|nr:hypothetical protein MARPO_0133s0017 [Marchantia polymorpha]BBN10458.1 hypothetical protein Mp_5g03720 [Marchantia polymorpha subsp. ruderalis]|eukprot:PTQ29868.1 hypothetical protein MARPO_0133s0017 [Marchantia polymorpha]
MIFPISILKWTSKRSCCCCCCCGCSSCCCCCPMPSDHVQESTFWCAHVGHGESLQLYFQCVRREVTCVCRGTGPDSTGHSSSERLHVAAELRSEAPSRQDSK